MPVKPTYPGVYIEELESSVHTITGVSTSITAFVGRALKGPIDHAMLIHNFADYVRIFGALWRESNMSYAVYHYFLNGGSDAIIVRVYRNKEYEAPKATFGRYNTDDVSPTYKIFFESSNPGAWANNLSILIDGGVNTELVSEDATLFNLYVKEKFNQQDNFDRWKRTGTIYESFLNLSLKENSPRYVDRVLDETSDLIRVDTEISNRSNLPNTSSHEDVIRILAESPLALPGLYSIRIPGSDGAALGVEDVYPTDPPDSQNRRGLYLLDNVDLFNLLCIPPFNGGENTTPNTTPASLYNRIEEYCEQRRAIVIIDPPANWNGPQNAIDNLHIFEARKNAALFFPRIRVADPLSEGMLRDFVPCGAIAGVIARTDSQRGVWKAPAGIDAGLNGVADLTVKLTDLENGDLNPLGINCLRIIAPAGIVVWGSRTMRGADRLADQWKYLSVRRTALYIEESLYRGTQWIVFEPNDEPLWAQIRLNVGAFMQDLFRKGAFQGSSPKEAYLVKCDHETTNQYDIDRGIVNILVGFAPLKPAEFVILQIKQLAGQEVS